MKYPAKWSLRCVDTGSEYCPCYLAESGNCLGCSLLAGQEFCDCNWSGTCSYLNYHFSQGNVVERCELTVAVDKIQLTAKLLELRFYLEPKWLPFFSHPGTFLFVRSVSTPNFAAVPISIVDATTDQVRLVVDCIGPKTCLLTHTDNQMIIRGPYYSGLSDSFILKNIRNANVILVAGGMGQSAVVLAAKTLLRGENRLWACLAPGSADVIYVEQTLKEYGVEVKKVTSMRQHGFKIIHNWFLELEPLLVVCAGSEKLQAAVWAMMQSVASKAEFVCSQNTVMCCGDGLCGSCLSTYFGQNRVPLCKAQYRFRRDN